MAWRAKDLNFMLSKLLDSISVLTAKSDFTADNY